MNSAILITYNEDDVVREALALCDSADYKVLHSIKQDFLRAPKYGISTGKIQELKDIIISAKPDVIVFDEVLKPSQNYNLACLLYTSDAADE